MCKDLKFYLLALDMLYKPLNHQRVDTLLVLVKGINSLYLRTSVLTDYNDFSMTGQNDCFI